MIKIANGPKIDQQLFCSSFNHKQNQSGHILVDDELDLSSSIEFAINDLTRGKSIPLLYFGDTRDIFQLARSLLREPDLNVDVISDSFRRFFIDELAESSQDELGLNIKKLSRLFVSHNLDLSKFANCYPQDLSFISYRVFTQMGEQGGVVILSSNGKALQKMFLCFCPSGLFIVNLAWGYHLTSNEEQFSVTYQTPCIIEISHWQGLNTARASTRTVAALIIKEQGNEPENIEYSVGQWHYNQLLTNQLLHGFYAIAMLLETVKPSRLSPRDLKNRWAFAKTKLTSTPFLSPQFSSAELPFNVITYFTYTELITALLDAYNSKLGKIDPAVRNFREFLRQHKLYQSQSGIRFAEMYENYYQDFGIDL